MNKQSKAPATRSEIAGATDTTKVANFSHTLMRSRILATLQGGWMYSTAELTKITGSADPRSIIRELRKSGWPIADVWEVAKGRRYKRYFIHQAEKEGNR